MNEKWSEVFIQQLQRDPNLFWFSISICFFLFALVCLFVALDSYSREGSKLRATLWFSACFMMFILAVPLYIAYRMFFRPSGEAPGQGEDGEAPSQELESEACPYCSRQLYGSPRICRYCGNLLKPGSR